MKISLYETPGLLLAAGLALGIYASPAASELRTYADGFIYDSSSLYVGPFQEQIAVTGPAQSSIDSGVVFNYPYPGYEGVLDDLQTTLYVRSNARADYGTNGAALELNFRATSGTDLGTLPVGDFSGSLPINSTMEPHASAQSSWTDTFTILGGTGVGTASAIVALHGHAETRYGANGDIWYGNSSFETFGTSGYGFAQYGLDINYEVLPPGVDGEYNQPIRWEQSYFPPTVPDYVLESPIPQDILTGNFAFEYGVPFSLSSYLTVAGYNGITVDFDHTATLSYFDLPEGASLESGSGHLYATSAVPVPAAVWLFGSGLLGLLGLARRKK
jgi:hypothetical protein